MNWFNTRRLLKPIGSIPPAEAEAAYYAALEPMLLAAQRLNPVGLRETRHGSITQCEAEPDTVTNTTPAALKPDQVADADHPDDAPDAMTADGRDLFHLDP